LRQFAFGFAVAAVYGILQMLHVVFGLFFALVIVSAIRGASLWLWSSFGKMATQAAEQMVEAKPAVFQPVSSQLHSE
jgi:enediyne biosynthesis protein E5